jgi:hypothetical protein
MASQSSLTIRSRSLLSGDGDVMESPASFFDSITVPNADIDTAIGDVTDTTGRATAAAGVAGCRGGTNGVVRNTAARDAGQRIKHPFSAARPNSLISPNQLDNSLRCRPAMINTKLLGSSHKVLRYFLIFELGPFNYTNNIHIKLRVIDR